MLSLIILSFSAAKSAQVIYCMTLIFSCTSLMAGFASNMASLFIDVAITTVVVMHVEIAMVLILFLLIVAYIEKLIRLKSMITVLKYLSNILPPEVFICVNFLVENGFKSQTVLSRVSKRVASLLVSQGGYWLAAYLYSVPQVFTGLREV